MLMILLQVSKLLAVMNVVSAISDQFSLPSLSDAIGENYWASYFHQASIGTHLTYQFLSHLTGRCKVQPLVNLLHIFMFINNVEFYQCLITNIDF